jgi:acetylornithine deacetylase
MLLQKLSPELKPAFYEEVIAILKKLISIPSFSKEEENTADCLEAFFKEKGIPCFRKMNNVWAFNKFYDPNKSNILLNSHHDTVKPNLGYTHSPFEAFEKEGKLYGLGSNDAGGALMSLLACFLHYYDSEVTKYNLVFAATAEEEISGKNGIELIYPEMGNIEVAIVGEPTQMKMAVAERGLMVLDCKVKGKAGHAAREEGENAIYKAMQDIEWFKYYNFPKQGKWLGKVKMSVTLIKAGTQHNVVPDVCDFTVDVRVPECYTNQEILDLIKTELSCEVQPRSLRLKSSIIEEDHFIVKAGRELGLEAIGSSTLSDRALLPCPSIKIGPGDSARSHTADEYIYLSEIAEGIEIYNQLLSKIL